MAHENKNNLHKIIEPYPRDANKNVSENFATYA